MAFRKQYYENINGIEDLYNKVTDFMENSLGWVVRKEGTNNLEKPYKIFLTTGESEQETCYIGVTYYRHSTDSAGVQFCAYTGFDDAKGFDDNLGHLSTCIDPYYSYMHLPTLGILPDDVQYDKAWFIGDKDCFIAVVRYLQFYRCCYVGLLRRYWSHQADPMPVFLFGSYHLGTPGCRIYTCGVGFTGASEGDYVWLWDCYDNWIRCFRLDYGDYLNAYGCIECITRGSCWRMWPHPHIQKERLLDPNAKILCPILIRDHTGIRGEMKWVYKVSSCFDVDPESTTTVGGQTYLLFPGDDNWNEWAWYAIRWYDD